MKTVGYLCLLLILPAALILQSCTSTITLSRAPSDLVLLNVQPNSSDVVKYDVTTNVSEPYKYKNNMGYEFVFHINQSFMDNIQSYMMTKFNKLANTGTDEPDVSINIILKSFEVGYELNQSVGDMLLNQGDAIVDVIMLSYVKVTKDGEVLGEKNIQSTTQYNERLDESKNVDHIYAKAANDGISKNIIMLDKYLVSIGL